MSKPVSSPNPINAIYKQRVRLAFLFILLCTLLLISRLVYIQILNHAQYALLSKHNQLKMNPILPERGRIYDRHLTPLAFNKPSFSLAWIKSKKPPPICLLHDLSQIMDLKQTHIDQFYKKARQAKINESVPIRRKLNENEIAAFALAQEYYPGIEIIAEPVRHYPFDTLLSHIIGYIGAASPAEQKARQASTMHYPTRYFVGKLGLEKQYEQQLQGQAGYRQVETDAHGHLVRVQKVVPPTAGQDLILSIDLSLQQKAEQALAGLDGAVVAIEPSTGYILAMVSKPSFDPNIFTQGIDQATYQLLQNQENRPLFNRAINGLYPPASTVKPIVGMAGLQSGMINSRTQLFDLGYFKLQEDGRKYRDWKPQGHGNVNLEKAIAEGCDTFFFWLAHRLGEDTLKRAFEAFGLGKPTGIDLPNESQGLVPNQDWKKRVKKHIWYPGDTLNMGIGQGFTLSTPLQIAQLASLLANRGVSRPPRLLMASKAHDQTEVKQIPLEKTSTLENFTPEHFKIMVEAMRKTLQNGGTAQQIGKGLRYTLAGKTGTAQVFNLKLDQKYDAHKIKKTLRDHSWFMGFAPIDNPEIAIAVLVENKYQRSAADVSRVILDHFFGVKDP